MLLNHRSHPFLLITEAAPMELIQLPGTQHVQSLLELCEAWLRAQLPWMLRTHPAAVSTTLGGGLFRDSSHALAPGDEGQGIPNS